MLEKMLAFTEARNQMLAENIANITTPGYRAKQLDVPSFQNALKEASERQAKGCGKFEVESSQVETDEEGLLKVTPSDEPVENLLFQDGTNARIEKQMAALAENVMMHQASSELLKDRLDLLTRAIRGRL